MIMKLNSLTSQIQAFHEKHGFDVGTKNIQTMLYRQNLLMEEPGEISQCLTKGKGDLAEEHADLLILLLGNCLVMDLDIEKVVKSKLEKIMQRPAKTIHGTSRVSEW